MQIALGVVAALGGFVDIGELVFNTQAGAAFGYQLLWTVPIGVVGIATYAEMCGRVATITKRAVGGIALVLHLYLAHIPFRVLLAIAAVAIILLVWVLPFEGIERIFGYGG